jgi:hypothetical protein
MQAETRQQGVCSNSQTLHRPNLRWCFHKHFPETRQSISLIGELASQEHEVHMSLKHVWVVIRRTLCAILWLLPCREQAAHQEMSVTSLQGKL